MERFTTYLGVVVAVLHLLAYILYNHQAQKGSSRPNVVTWMIVFFLMSLNAGSYFAMSADWVKSLQVIAGTIGATLIFWSVLLRNKFVRPTRHELVILTIGFAAIFVWWVSREATYANLLIITAISIGFLPTIEGVWRDPNNEEPLAWYVWMSAFALGIIVVALRYSGQPQDFAYPVVGLVLDSTVAFLSRKSRKLRFALGQ